jgi:DNA polymerase zeta
LRKGVIVVWNPLLEIRALGDVPSQVVDTELDLLNTIVDLVLDLDPDVIAGWEVQSSSWGYLGARGQQYGLCQGNYAEQNYDADQKSQVSILGS